MRAMCVIKFGIESAVVSLLAADDMCMILIRNVNIATGSFGWQSGQSDFVRLCNHHLLAVLCWQVVAHLLMPDGQPQEWRRVPLPSRLPFVSSGAFRPPGQPHP